MTVYNYVRVGPPGGEASIHDAPPEVTAAIESWLDEKGDAESGKGVAYDLLPEPRLGLLVLRHAISSDERYALGLVHVVAVPEDRFAGASQPALAGFFESLYGSPLSIALPKLLGALAGATREETTARVEEGFAGESHLELIDFADSGDFASPDPEPIAESALRDESEVLAKAVGESPAPPAQPRRRTGRLAAGLGLLAGAALGVALAYSPVVESYLPRFAPPAAPAPQAQERLVRLEQLVDRLQEQERVSRSAFAALERAHADTVSQLSQALEALEERSAAVAAQPAPPPAESAAAASPVVSERRPFRIVARSARVRAGPSKKERTRGLLAQGQRVVVTDERDAWLEIEPPPGFAAPTWIHRALVEAVEDAAVAPGTGATAEDAALAPAGPPLG